MILLKNSEVAKDTEMYGNLYAAISSYESVSISDLESDDSIFDSRSKTVLNHDKDILISNMKKEWVGNLLNDVAEKEIHCQLCGHKNILIYWIKNKLNGNELHVGSECIKEFSGIENIDKLQKDGKEQQKQRRKEQRTLRFDEEFPAHRNFVKCSEDDFNNIDIVLPFNLYNNIKKSLYDLNFIRTDYVKNGGDFEELKSKYCILVNRQKTLWEKAKEYYKNNYRKKLVCNKETGDWLIKNHPDTWEKVAKDGGILSVETLKNVYNDSFIKKFLKDFQKSIKTDGLTISRLKQGILVFQLINLKYPNGIIFEVKSKWFMDNIGRFCLTSKAYCYHGSDLIEGIEIPNYEHNIDSIIEHLNYILQPNGHEIVFSRKIAQLYYKTTTTSRNRRTYSNKIHFLPARYKKVQTSFFLSKYSNKLFSDDKEQAQYYNKVFKNLEMKGDWMSKDQKDAFEKIASEEASMQKQRGFIPYA